MRWTLSRPAEVRPELEELVFLTRGIGRILMEIDAKLEVIVEDLEGEDADGD